MIRFGIIGCGRISSRHAQSILEISRGKLVAVADVKESRAKNLASKYGGATYKDYRQLLDRHDIDVVNIWIITAVQIRRS